MTPGKQLLNGLNLPFSESMALWVVGTACSQDKSQVGSKFLVFSAGEVCHIVIDDLH